MTKSIPKSDGQETPSTKDDDSECSQSTTTCCQHSLLVQCECTKYECTEYRHKCDKCECAAWAVSIQTVCEYVQTHHHHHHHSRHSLFKWDRSKE